MTDALVLADAGSLPDGPVWGPDAGEALDWLTLARLLGWSVTAADRDREGLLAGPGVAIVAGSPDDLPARRLDELGRALERRPMLVVARPGADGGAWARLAGAALSGAPAQSAGPIAWHGPGPSTSWNPSVPAELAPFDLERGVESWSTLGGRPCVAARRLPGGSVVATIGLVGSGGAGMAARKRLLTCGCPFPTAWLDLARCLLLRMDDPGASANVHLRTWSYAKLGERDWAAVGAALRERGARLSIAYTPGWVDDGDERRGALEVGGRPVEPRAVAVHPSPLVVHTDLRGNAPGRVNDYRAEFRGVRRLAADGLAGVELHGYTHLAEDLSAWSQAADRYDAVAWYREFDEGPQPPAGHPLPDHHVQLGAALMREHFADAPTALVCPGQSWTELVMEQALAVGLRLVSADGLALRDQDRFCWCAAVPTVYLDKPDQALFDTELPVTGLFHDLEPATGGVEWLTWHLDGWRRAGARRFIDLRELAAALELRLRLRPASPRGWRLETGGASDLPLPRPMPVLLRTPSGEPPSDVELAGGSRAPVQRLEGGLGRLLLPPGG